METSHLLLLLLLHLHSHLLQHRPPLNGQLTSLLQLHPLRQLLPRHL
jgi:hypothetical protein